MMDRRERSGDSLAALLVAQESWSNDLRVAMPGIIQSFDASKCTAVIQPAIRAQVTAEDGTTKWVDYPLLLDCPVVFPRGGGFVLTFPIKAGDECAVIIADRCIDAWWQSGGTQNQVELRMHDLSDAFCLPGPRSVPNVEGGISTTDVQLRSVDGTAHVSIKANKDVDVLTPGTALVTAATATLNASVQANITAPIIALTGRVQIHGSVETDGGGIISMVGTTVSLVGPLSINGGAFLGHTHSGVTAGAAHTGGVP